MIQFNTANQTFRQVMGNSQKYKVPRFQRDYSWTEEQWEELWQDVIAFSEDPQPAHHYMGYLVLQSSDNINFTVIDGQQRLTTISILILAGLFELQNLIENNKETKENQKRLDTFKNNFIGFTDTVSLSTEYKLTLNRNNDRHFKTSLCDLIKPPVRNINYSERLMGKALDYFQIQLRAYLKDNLTGKKIASFIEKLSNALFFTTITVSNDINAYTIFETLNARGVHLSTPDLVKNYVFSTIDNQAHLHDNLLQQWEDKWSSITGQLGKNKFSDFIRVDWNSQNSFSRQKELFKKIKNYVNSPQSAQEYLKNMQKNAPVYSALQSAEDEYWRHYKNGEYNTPNLKLSLKMLNMFNIVAPQSALLAGFNNLKPRDFIKFLFYIEVLSVRYNIIGNRRSFQQESVYSEVANVLQKKGSLSSVLPIIKKIYPSDEEFISLFTNKRFKTKQTFNKARFFLYRIERHLSGGENINYDETTLEHILPQNPLPEWHKAFDEEEPLDELVEHIGNLTLLSQIQNKQLGRNGFAEKKAFFNNSPFKITKKCGEYPQWNKQSIMDRQRWLGSIACKLFCLPS